VPGYLFSKSKQLKERFFSRLLNIDIAKAREKTFLKKLNDILLDIF
jgi:hypothetical protein